MSYNASYNSKFSFARYFFPFKLKTNFFFIHLFIKANYIKSFLSRFFVCSIWTAPNAMWSRPILD